ncbi:serine/arginine-rich SC35-like splicing factor SCL28 [Rhododendron vialii]|uniref:serine/arginine-rich SC35-like splicing factor SCL28 n=1 Tax=Rhododendron vialii TaxID=182163 RepID=UPI00265F63EE|nr:serine/arginine-rich SC35-like splicing factor SCL28 [Rhododendron vialii]
MGRYRSRSRSPSPRRSSKRYDDPRDSSRSRRDRRSPAPSGLLVRNISLDARPEDLRIPFERFGAIKDIYLPKNYYTGEPRGFGFVKFRYPEDAADAKEQLNRTVIGGREIRIVFAEENRKTPHEMRRTTRPSGRGSYRRRSPVGSPRRRHRSYSGSLSPARSDSRDRRARDDDYSPRRSRSVSKSVSPRDERNYRSKMKSPRRSRSISRSPSPRDKRNYRSDLRSPSPRVNGKNPHDERYDEQSRSQSPRRNARIPSRSPSRSLSPR